LPGLSEIQERSATVLDWLRLRAASSGRLRLRTKFLLSLVLVIAALTFSTLLIVGHSAEGLVQKAIEQDTRNSVLTFSKHAGGTAAGAGAECGVDFDAAGCESVDGRP
jgi:hypothetical protein